MAVAVDSMDMVADAPGETERSLGIALPPMLGAAADLGVLLSLALVLLGWGPIGAAAGICLGTVSITAVIMSAMQSAAKRVAVPSLRQLEPAYELARK